MLRQNRRRILSGLGTLSVGFLAGCTGDSDEPTDTTPPTNNDTETATDTSPKNIGVPQDGDPQGITNPDIRWEERYSFEDRSGGSHSGNEITHAHGSGAIIAGATAVETNDSSARVGALVNIDQDGNIRWKRRYGDGQQNVFNTIRPTEDGYIAAGFRRDSFEVPGEKWILKLDRDGQKQWDVSRRVDGFEGEFYQSVSRYKDGYFLAGSGTTAGTITRGPQAVHIGPGGDVQWQWSRTGDVYQLPRTHIVDDGILLAGSATRDGSTQGQQPWLIRLEDGGSVVWEQRYQMTGDMKAATIADAVSLSDGYLLAVLVSDNNRSRPALFRTDETGTVQWQETYPGQNQVVPTALKAPTDDRFYLAAWVNIPVDGSGTRLNTRLFEIDDTGSVQWSQDYGDESTSMSPESLLLRDDGFVLGGDKYDENRGDSFWAMKLE